MKSHRRMELWLLVLLLLLLSLSVAAADTPVGTVLYHQDFSVAASPTAAGIGLGTSSSQAAWLSIEDEWLGFHVTDDHRAYALLPETPWTDDHTIQFSFRFTDALTKSGYMAFLLTSWGDEPSNISAVVFRVSGMIDDFTAPTEAMQEKMRDGETIAVELPVENGVIHAITLTAGEETCTVTRNAILRIAEGGRGFGLRNASVEIGEVYIVNGTGYTAKTGPFVEMSWSESELAADILHAPPTADCLWISAAFLLSGIGVIGNRKWAKRRK